MDRGDDDQWALNDLSRRQALLLAAGGAVVVGGSRNQTNGPTQQYDESIVDSHIKAAAEFFDDNFEQLSSLDEASVKQLYSINTGKIEANLQAAQREIRLAKDEVGDEVIPMLVTEAEDYLWYQHLALEAFDIPGEWSDEGFTDPRLAQVIKPLTDTSDSDEPAEIVDPEKEPYGVEHYRREFSAAEDSLSLTELGDYLSHTVEDMNAIVQSGVEVLSDLSTVYKMLRAHVLLPRLTQRVLEIDRTLSQSTSLITIATDEQRGFQTLMQEIGMVSKNISSSEFLTQQIEALSLSVEEIQMSFNDLVRPFEKVSTSLSALSTGKHKESTQLWSEAIEAMFTAYDESPIINE